jgi:hypothetical protein
MKNNILFNKVMHYLGALVIALFAFMLFQGQDVVDENDPMYERPTRESMSHFTPPNQTEPMTITVDDYDNFEMGQIITNSITSNSQFIMDFLESMPQASNARGTTTRFKWY